MENNFSIGGVISLVYMVAKFIEIRIIHKETKPLHEIIRETIIVYISAITGLALYHQISRVDVISESTGAFLGDPDF